MDRVRCAAAAALALGCRLAAGSALTDQLEACAKERSLDGHKPIEVAAEGTAQVPFDAAYPLFCRPDVLAQAQATYAQKQPDGHPPKFTVEQAGSNSFHFVNAEGQPSDVDELRCIGAPAGGSLLVVFDSRGKRFFGSFEALIGVQVQRQSESTVSYSVCVYAYPDCGLVRVVGRHLPFIESYFRHKTAKLIHTVESVAAAMCAAQQEPQDDD